MGLSCLVELHHIPGGVVGECGIQGGDEAVGSKRERDAGRHDAEFSKPALHKNYDLILDGLIARAEYSLARLPREQLVAGSLNPSWRLR